MGIPSKCEEVVLRVYMHSEADVNDVGELALAFEGVKDVKADQVTSRLTVNGEVDPSKIKAFLSKETKQTVEIISFSPKEEPWEVIHVGCLCTDCLGNLKEIIKANKGIADWFADPVELTVRIRMKAKTDTKALRKTLEDTLKKHDCKDIVVWEDTGGEMVATAERQLTVGSRPGSEANEAGTNNIYIHNVTIEKLYLSRPPPPDER